MCDEQQRSDHTLRHWRCDRRHGRDPSFSVTGLSASTNNTAANDNRHMTIDIERQPTGSVPSVLALRGASWEARRATEG
jgi:hypothetical protein